MYFYLFYCFYLPNSPSNVVRVLPATLGSDVLVLSGMFIERTMGSGLGQPELGLNSAHFLGILNLSDPQVPLPVKHIKKCLFKI